LEVLGRKSGKIISFLLAMTVMNRERHLVSIIWDEPSLVQNVNASNRKERLVHGINEQVLQEEVDIRRRA
jgi:hypothetical protein